MTVSPIPESALENALAVIGSIGSGKTYSAKGAVEGLLEQSQRVCIIDPTGAWWGLRLRADGGGQSGLNVVIFGGDHADVPITPLSGTKMGELIAAGTVPQALIDLSDMGTGEMTDFLSDFLERLYDKNREALHLILDEADIMAPQRPGRDQQTMQAAIDRIVRRGRNRGFRPMLITQRPQVIDKNVLSQCAAMVVLALRSPQDRAAITAWVEGNASRDEAKVIVSQLASLERGTGFIWAPQLGMLEKVTFPLISTFDSSRAPQPGERRAEPVPLAKLDMDAIAKALAPPPPEGEKVTVPPVGSITIDVEALKKTAYEAGLKDGYANAIYHRDELAKSVWQAYKAFGELLGDLTAPTAAQANLINHPCKVDPVIVLENQDEPDLVGSKSTVLSAMARKIVDEIHAAHPVSLTFKTAAMRAGASPRSSAFNTYRKQVSACHEVELHGADRYKSLRPSAGPSGDVIEQFAAKMPPSWGTMLRVIAAAPTGLTRGQVADRAGVSQTSSGLAAGLKELIELDLIEKLGETYQLTDHAR